MIMCIAQINGKQDVSVIIIIIIILIFLWNLKGKVSVFFII